MKFSTWACHVSIFLLTLGCVELKSVGVKASYDHVCNFGIMRTDSRKYTRKEKLATSCFIILYNLIDKAVMVLSTICTDSGLYTGKLPEVTE